MRQRCLNPRNREYANYGGRGITICDRWRDSFLNFYADVGERPEGCTLDRIDNDRGYEPDNVRWALLTTQNRNTRATKLTEKQVAELHQLYASGWQKKPLARHFGLAPKTVRQILSGTRWKDQYNAIPAAPLTEAAGTLIFSRKKTDALPRNPSHKENADMSDNDSSGPAAQEKLIPPRRVARPVAPVQDAVVLADLSDSMNDRDGVRGERMPLRRIDRLAKVLDYLLTRVRVRSLVCFNDVPVEIALSGRIALPEPTGSTGLTLALEHVAGMQPRPARCILISDGMPNSVSLALEAARALKPMVLDAYYVGPDGLDVALRFMADLAAAGGPGGKSGRFDLADPVLLGTELQKRLLLAPGR